MHDPQRETSRIDQQQPQFVTDTSQLKSTDTTNPSIDSCELPLIDTSIRTSINTRPRDMVATLILVRDENGDLHGQEVHMLNATSQSNPPEGVKWSRSTKSEFGAELLGIKV
ncbi:hypothetical protein DY000_02007562 [Brassica cretica]|uniref:Uncharacterized protein n=1 Tax=Brassica cretica TaxID=69181 RepID=A0ABQ7C5J9_BRACR|nr:hypothetical protein DY000_02007562 [Brassica cretica]